MSEYEMYEHRGRGIRHFIRGAGCGLAAPSVGEYFDEVFRPIVTLGFLSGHPDDDQEAEMIAGAGSWMVAAYLLGSLRAMREHLDLADWAEAEDEAYVKASTDLATVRQQMRDGTWEW